MNVWTVSSRNDTVNGSDHFVVGSYASRGRALDKCANFIFDRLAHWDGFAYSMAHDENHPETARFFSTRRAGGTMLRRNCTKELWNYVRGVLGQDGAYCVFDGTDSWYFDIDENGVEGELWHTLTWGDSDCEDLNFRTPYPEAFTSEKTAVETFIGYVKDLYRSHCMKWSDEFLRETRRSLRKDCRVQVDLNDGTSVSCVLYHDDAKNIKE